MAMRLPDYEDLAEDGGTPPWLTREHGAAITWTAFLVASPDLQDMRAAERWVEARKPDELARIQVVINRANGEGGDVVSILKSKLGVPSTTAPGALTLYGGNLLLAPMVVRDQAALRLFDREDRERGALAAPQDLGPLVERARE
jgi:hypothetical protein